jgi:hypothetical protein
MAMTKSCPRLLLEEFVAIILASQFPVDYGLLVMQTVKEYHNHEGFMRATLRGKQPPALLASVCHSIACTVARARTILQFMQPSLVDAQLKGGTALQYALQRSDLPLVQQLTTPVLVTG